MLRRVVPLICAALALAACSGSGSPKPTATPSADALAVLATRGAAAAFTASYAFHQVSPDTTAIVKVWRAEPSLRVDVVAGATTATLLMTSTGSYSCSINAAKRSCLLVAGAGAPVPAPFDVAPVNLFSADLLVLAAHTASYDVKGAPALPASGQAPAAQIPAAQCFDVSAVASTSPSPTPTSSSAPSATVPAGRYCFTSAGVLAAASYPSGNTITLTSLQTATPSPATFTPYAKPSPLPS